MNEDLDTFESTVRTVICFQGITCSAVYHPELHELIGDAWVYDAEGLVSQRERLCPSVLKVQICSAGSEGTAMSGVKN